MLKNETKSVPLKTALDEITCILNTPEQNLNENSDVTKKPEQVFDMEAAGEVLKGSNDKLYDDLTQYKLESTDEPVVQNQITLTDIPHDSLPCPRDLVDKGEDSLMLSSKDESFWLSGSGVNVLIDLSLLTITLLVMI